MTTPQIPLADYVAIMRKATPTDHPYTDHPTHAIELGDTFAALMHSLADFVEVGTDAIGYEVVRDTLEDIVHTLPVQEDGNLPEREDPFAAMLAALGASVQVVNIDDLVFPEPTLIDEEGNVNPDALPEN